MNLARTSRRGASRPRAASASLRLLRTPKRKLVPILLGIAAIGALLQYCSEPLITVALAVGSASALDLALFGLRERRGVPPDGAALTGLILAMVLSAREPWYVPVAGSVVAIGSKHILRSLGANIFNPAALALVAVAVVFQSGEDWWGSLPSLGGAGAAIVVLGGGWIAAHVNKLPMVISFLTVYLGLCTIFTFFGGHGAVAEVFRAPDVHAALFFALFMLDDPPTSPVRSGDQALYGALVGSAASFLLVGLGWLTFLPAALLLGNGWEAFRRWSLARDRKAKRASRVPPRSLIA